MDSTELSEREAVRRTVTGVVHHIDHRRWPELRALFADAVTIDYTSLFGGEVQTQKGDDLVGGWRKLLSPVTATQHLLGPIDVVMNGGEATATCHVRGYHFAKGLPDGDVWLVAGHYVFALAPEAAGWKIRKMTLQTLYQTGNTKLLEQVASR
jgi:SnoaL-like protein